MFPTLMLLRSGFLYVGQQVNNREGQPKLNLAQQLIWDLGTVIRIHYSGQRDLASIGFLESQTTQGGNPERSFKLCHHHHLRCETPWKCHQQVIFGVFFSETTQGGTPIHTGPPRT